MPIVDGYEATQRIKQAAELDLNQAEIEKNDTIYTSELW